MERRIVALIAVVLSTIATARADDLPAGERLKRARAHFERGRASFALEEFETAIREFEAGYRLVPQPLFLYNLAQSARRAGLPEKAVACYREYLKVRPDAPEREEVEQRIVELEAQLPFKPRPPPVITAPPPSPVVIAPPAVSVAPPARADRSRALKLAGVSVGVIGVGALVSGVAASVAAEDAAENVRESARLQGSFDPTVEDRGRAAEAASIAMLALGGVAVVTGAILYALGHREAARGGATVAFNF